MCLKVICEMSEKGQSIIHYYLVYKKARGVKIAGKKSRYNGSLKRFLNNIRQYNTSNIVSLNTKNGIISLVTYLLA